MNRQPIKIRHGVVLSKPDPAPREGTRPVGIRAKTAFVGPLPSAGEGFERSSGASKAVGLATVLIATAFQSHAQSVIAWGNNSQGQTSIPASATNVIAVAAGWHHNLALRADGTVVSWGAGTTVPGHVTNIQAIAAGANHSVALRAGGSVVAWGDNTHNQTSVPGSATNVIAITAGYHHTLALRADGTVVAWGRNNSGQTNVPPDLSRVVAISAGAEQSLVMLDDGSFVEWGRRYPTPKRLRDAHALSSGATYNLALRGDGRAVVWGNYAVNLIPPPSATNLVAIASGTNFNLGLSAAGRILAWGSGVATNVPASATNIFAIAAGAAHGVAIRGDGRPRMVGPVACQSFVSLGNPLPVAARVVSSEPFDCQWWVNGTLAGDNSRTPFLAAAVGADELVCQVIVSNSLGSATSAVSTITVRALNIWGENRAGQRDIPRSVLRPAQIGAGGFHNLAIQPDGTVVGWGKNVDGQTNVPPTATNIVAVAAGGDHSLALRDDGSVIAWGRNWDGQTDVPPTATNVMAIAAGWAHSTALRADGSVVAWGNNEYQQSSVSFLATDVIAIACGYYHTLALRADRAVVSWGLTDPVPPSVTNVVAIAAGFEHSLALRADGSLIAWGGNTYGQTNVPPAVTNVVAIAAAWYHNLALRADGTVVAWGKDFAGGATRVPVALSNVIGIAVGEDFSAALVGQSPPEFSQQVNSAVVNFGGLAVLHVGVQGTSPLTFQWFHDGTPVLHGVNQTLILNDVQLSSAGNYVLVVSNQFGLATNQPIALTVLPEPATVSRVGGWGDNVNGQCDIPPTIFSPQAIAAGRGHVLALQGDGTVVAWGDNQRGQTNVPPAATNVIAVAAGNTHSLALRSDGTIVGWGTNFAGASTVPMEATNAVQIAAGSDHSVALRADGSVIAWGDNSVFNHTNIPPLLRRVIAVAAGHHHTLALLSDNTVVSWGMLTSVPSSATNVVAIAAGFNQNLALRADGTVVAWGDNSFGQTDVPASATNIVGLAAGFFHSLALRADGVVVAWGAEQLDATNVPSLLRNVARVAANDAYSLGVIETGPPRFIRQPDDAVAHVGGRVIFATSLAGTHPFTGQWFHDQTPIAGATNRFLMLTDVQAAAAGDYWFAATNALGVASSQPGHLTVHASPWISTAPTRKLVPPGEAVCLPAHALGVEPLSYQWRHNNQVLTDNGRISGAATATLCLNDASYGDAGDYVLVVTNVHGTVTGLVAQLIVSPVLAWGKNLSGQLDVPVSATNVAGIAAGGDASLGLKPNGTLAVWGDTADGQDAVPSWLTDVIAVAEGDAHALALRADGTVVAWGTNTDGQTNVPPTATGVVAVAAGHSHSLALRADGSAIAWGWPSTLPPTFSNVVAIAAGKQYSLALRSDGTVVSSSTDVPSEATNIVAIAAGDGHRLALTAEGNVLAWGNNFAGQTNVPPTATNVVAIRAGGDHSLALRADGVVIAWGDNHYGETDVPAAGANVVAIAAGANHSLALRGGPGQPPAIQQPARAAELGGATVLMGGAADVRGTVYQWQLNGRDLAGATNAWLLVDTIHWTNSGAYRVVISNVFGVVVGEPVVLAVLRTPLRFETAGVIEQEPGRQFHARLLGASGVGPLIIYASTNLQVWTPVYTNPPVIGAIDFSDAVVPGGPGRMYRAAELSVPSELSLEIFRSTAPEPSQRVPLRVTGLSALGSVTIFASTNLVDWRGIFTNPPTMGPLEFWDAPAADQTLRFYRAGEIQP